MHVALWNSESLKCTEPEAANQILNFVDQCVLIHGLVVCVRFFFCVTSMLSCAPWLQRRSNAVASSHKYCFVDIGIPELWFGSKAGLIADWCD
jgi:hypothetical protein